MSMNMVLTCAQLGKTNLNTHYTVGHKSLQQPRYGLVSNLRRSNTPTNRNICTAAYNPSMFPAGNQGNGPSPLHGVFLSSDLPPILADRVSVYDARDALETCNGLDACDKDACYAVFGLDSNAEKWFSVVYSLEQALEMETDPEEEAAHHGKEKC